MATCSHLDQVTITELPAEVAGCEDCLATGDPWLHLRICLECGKVGCCDDSTNRHAMELARRGAGEGEVVVAEAQTAGRGRLGRSFFSPAGTRRATLERTATR